MLASLMVSVRQHGKRFLELALALWRQSSAAAVDWSGEGLPGVEAEQAAEPEPCRRRSGAALGVASG